MPREIIIDPVTRIEGHAKITVFLDDDGRACDARFHVTEFRGFEKFCEGRPLWEMPGITARVCGICPVSHLLASAKAGDRILAVTVPPAALKLRRLMNLGQILQSHALSFFHLSSPDFLLGFGSDPAKRNIFGLIGAEPEFARGGIRLRQFGQEVIELLGGRKIHPAWAVPGGVRQGLDDAGRTHLRDRLPECLATIRNALGRFKGILDTHREEAAVFGDFPSLHLSLVGPDGLWEHHEGTLRFVDEKGDVVADLTEPERYGELIGEHGEPDSYLKSPYFRPRGFPDGVYRVGPLARLNVCSRFGTPEADRELAEYRGRHGRVVTGSLIYHHARLIEILGCLERIAAALDDADLNAPPLRADAGINRSEAVGISEAPRGTLFHHYRVAPDGTIKAVNLIIATGQNNLAMNRTVAQIARHYVKGPDIPEEMLNRVEAGIRAYDPCLSCSTHAVGQMPLRITLVAPDGRVVAERTRE